MTIKNKLVSSILAFLTPMIFIIIMISYRNFSQSSVNYNIETLSLTSSAVSKAVGEKMNDYFNLAEYSSKMYSLAPEDNFDDNTEFILGILDHLSSQSKLNDTSFAYKDGRTYSKIREDFVPGFNAKEKKREWFTRIFDGEKRVLTTPYASSAGDIVMSLSVPVIVGKEIYGVILVNLPLDEITNFTKSILEFENIYLTREDGYLMASKDVEEIGSSLWDIIPSFESFNDSSESGQLNFSLDNDSYLGNFSTIESLGWKVWTYEKESTIQEASDKNLIFSILLGLIALIVSAILLLIIARSITKPLNTVNKSLEEISKGGGDLTKQIVVNSKDETFELAQNFNKFTENLKGIVTNIKGTSVNSNNIGLKLNDSSGHAASASIEITKNVETISSQIKLLNSNINETTSGIYEISSNITQFKHQIDEQVSAVEQSSASVEEMIASLENVSGITNKKLDSTKQLVNTTKAGEKLLTDTSVSFKEGISDKIDNIKDMVDVISNISERTNLLAMNAAIEAAHAGDAGKGFAVVSDEIRKMAEEASTSSSSISNIISIIIEAINVTDDNIDNTSKAFASIFKEVEEIDTALNEIAANTVELASGGDEILKAVSLLNDTTSNISNGIVEIEAGASDVTQAMVQVQNISNEVFSGVSEISIGITEVSTSFQEVSELAEEVNQESENLTKEVGQFII